MTVEIMRTDKSACDLRCAAAACRDAKAARRMLAIALILDGTDRKTAAPAQRGTEGGAGIACA